MLKRKNMATIVKHGNHKLTKVGYAKYSLIMYCSKIVVIQKN